MSCCTERQGWAEWEREMKWVGTEYKIESYSMATLPIAIVVVLVLW